MPELAGKRGTQDAAGPTGEVLALLRREAEIYERLEAQMARQRSLICGEDMGRLLEVLARRRELAGELAKVGERLGPIRRDWPAHRDRLSPPQREEADRLIVETTARMGRMIESDSQDARVLSARKNAVGAELRSARAGVEALAAYRPERLRDQSMGLMDEAS